MTTRTLSIPDSLRALRREFSAGNWQDLEDQQLRTEKLISKTRESLQRFEEGMATHRWEMALQALGETEMAVQAADEAVDAAADRLRTLREFKQNPPARLDRAKFIIRDAQMLVMRGPAETRTEYANALDRLVLRLDRLGRALEAVHPNYWSVLGELDYLQSATKELVGRDILIGAVSGLAIVVISSLHYFIRVWLLGEPSPAPYSFSNPGGAALLGHRGFPILFLNQVSASLVFGFMTSFLILFLTLLFRRKWLGYAAFWFLMAIFAIGGETSTANLLSGAIWAVLFPTYLLLIATRFGVLAIVSGFVFHHLIVFYPITTELAAWYAGDFVLCLIVLLALAVYGFYTSLAGQKIFEPGFLKDLEC